MRTTTALATIAAGLFLASVARADDAGARHDALRAALAKRRAEHLASFHRFRLTKVYPHNSYEPGMLNVWTDADGHLCAVATMMADAGQAPLVTQTASADNYVRVSQLADGPVLDWVLTSGLTQEEIVMIQAPTEADLEADAAAFRRARRREDRRLAENYRATEQALRGEVMTNAGLDLAVSRLERRPELAAAVLATQPATNP
jgi:hypothetical protein